ncbi:MAG: exonuclease [Dehalococcoidia bacterium]|nr:exonuclease [Dehalococcoidia bacterium]
MARVEPPIAPTKNVFRTVAGERSRSKEGSLAPSSTPTFVAIDFETADRWPDSACAVGLVRVEGGRIVRREARLIRPPRSHVDFSAIHGITWADVARKPVFAEVWSELADLLEGTAFLAAHNAAFDRGVLAACCATAGLEPPALPFVCTVQLARRTWSIYPTKLPNVCERLGIVLHHHNPLSDAEACAQIVMRAAAAGIEKTPGAGSVRRE